MLRTVSPLHYEILARLPAGEAHPTPLLFVHGAWCAAWVWDEHLLPWFAERGYAAHALSLRGHGTSWGTSYLARIEDYVTDVALVTRTLPAPPVLIGHSMGGFLAQKYAERYEARALVLMASVPPQGARRSILHTITRQPVDALRALATLNTRAFLDTPEKARHHLYSRTMPEAQLTQYAARIEDESALWLLDIAGLELPRVERIRVPMLVLGAADDTLFTTAEVQATAAAYGADCFILPNMAHNMMLEAGWAEVADIILRWLRMQGI